MKRIPTNALRRDILHGHPWRMVKWLVAAGALLVALGVLLWQLAATPRPVVTVSSNARSKVQTAATSSVPTPAPEQPKAAEAAPTRAKPSMGPRASNEPSGEKLDPQSDEFNHRVDVIIIDRFRLAAARCYGGPFDSNLKMIIKFRLHIKDSEVFATDVSVGKNEIEDEELVQCMVAAVERARWRAEDLPDLEEDQELFIRLRALKKYQSQEVQEAN